MTEQALRDIADMILEYTRKNAASLNSSLVFEDYHGFQIASFPEELLKEKLQPFHFTPADVEVEFVRVTSNLKDQIHYHEGSTAYVQVLGKEEGFPASKNAIAYKDEAWMKVSHGDGWTIMPKTVHGFSVEAGGDLTFLSVQSPPIVQGMKDDYHPVV